ncbi:phage repressor protein CI [Xenorhabdus griffiniae]|uniref:Phage repressor protein CI n=1 Tax=Xenorhabdus griffiniae TaxID=351672 RepID=A0ABY9XKY4_9GAMM|nr:phage repressor protein CI [Xenorhabdus griffiniae]MBD1229370.1 phage repressor protein CI [Xenorhabdus griffiniae]MBE8589123.1 phage repressor protein CI [Xenorhabdus griffiniae]WMV73608.1 phage repressor protein CI [Xenorhabdus griffiniae]WNH03288.1 phage repressor protein CI [Xenorhabdus griffiniae]
MKPFTNAREAIERICQAYEFTSFNQLATYLSTSSGSLGNRMTRNNFPYDLVLRCALETGASIEWLSYGTGSMSSSIQTKIEADAETIKLATYKLADAKLLQSSALIFDKVMLPKDYGDIEAIRYGSDIYFIDRKQNKVNDGNWLIEFSGKYQFKELELIPGNKIRMDGGKYPIDCDIDDITVIGKVISIYTTL